MISMAFLELLEMKGVHSLVDRDLHPESEGSWLKSGNYVQR